MAIKNKIILFIYSYVRTFHIKTKTPWLDAVSRKVKKNLNMNVVCIYMYMLFFVFRKDVLFVSFVQHSKYYLITGKYLDKICYFYNIMYAKTLTYAEVLFINTFVRCWFSGGFRSSNTEITKLSDICNCFLCSTIKNEFKKINRFDFRRLFIRSYRLVL